MPMIATNTAPETADTTRPTFHPSGSALSTTRWVPRRHGDRRHPHGRPRAGRPTPHRSVADQPTWSESATTTYPGPSADTSRTMESRASSTTTSIDPSPPSPDIDGADNTTVVGSRSDIEQSKSLGGICLVDRCRGPSDAFEGVATLVDRRRSPEHDREIGEGRHQVERSALHAKPDIAGESDPDRRSAIGGGNTDEELGGTEGFGDPPCRRREDAPGIVDDLDGDERCAGTGIVAGRQGNRHASGRGGRDRVLQRSARNR